MCGIAGVVGPGARAHAARVERMLSSMRHRGPDDAGIAVFDNAVVGTARLSVIDLDHGGQPLFGSSGRTALVCNGEIYGHRRIRKEHGSYPFTSGSDCEVILPLYEQHGVDLLENLPGTFAFALWDERSHTLLAARDRFGERPLYYALLPDGGLVFASESSALRASGLVEGGTDRDVVAHYLRQSYVPPGRSIWAGICSLGPAEELRWTAERGVITRRWWRPPVVSWRPTRAEASEWFREGLDRAVCEQLESDVPVGAFLSGGVDSTTIAALAGRHHQGLKAFTFDMPGQSEVPYARETAALHGLELHVCDAETTDLAAQVVEMARVWDEPFGDSSALPTLQLCRFAREHVTVVLTGDGADELLGGYLAWARQHLGEHWDPTDPASVEEDVPRASLGSRLRRHLLRGDPAANGDGAPSGSLVARRYASFREYFSSEELEALGVAGIGAGDVDTSEYFSSTVDDIARFDLDHYLPGDVLVKTDRASMLHGLEVRSPFLDVKVAEGCLSLPAHQKVDTADEKLLLRRAFRSLWPESVATRPKQGFGAPLAEWLGRADMIDLTRAHLVDRGSPLFDLLDRDAVVRYAQGRDQRTWNLLVLSIWWEHHRGSEVIHGS